MYKFWSSVYNSTRSIIQQTTTRSASGRNPFERRTGKQIYESLTGGEGGRKGRGKKWTKLPWVRPKRIIELGRGAKGRRWPGLSHPLPKVKTTTNPWLHKDELKPKTVQEDTEEFEKISHAGKVNLNVMEGLTRVERTLPETNWSRKGWNGRSFKGRYVGVPEAPDGTPLTDFHCIILDLKRVRYIKYSGKTVTTYCFVVVGNTKGMIGFAGAEATELRAVIRKAKNRAVKQLQQVPICEGHTIFHNVHVKCVKTHVYMERKLKGYGLRCNRNLQAVMKLVGIKDIRIKQVGRSNIKHLTKAAVKGLLSQTTYEKLANDNGKCVVQYKTELGDRPLVVAVPKSTEPSFINWLKEHQMLHPDLEKELFPPVTTNL